MKVHEGCKKNLTKIVNCATVHNCTEENQKDKEVAREDLYFAWDLHRYHQTKGNLFGR